MKTIHVLRFTTCWLLVTGGLCCAATWGGKVFESCFHFDLDWMLAKNHEDYLILQLCILNSNKCQRDNVCCQKIRS